MKAIAAICLVILLFSCTKPKEETYLNMQVDSFLIGKVKTIVILGNSIVRHIPRTEIGWNNDWGMAATSRDSDFVHLLIRNIQAKDTSAKVVALNIAEWEQNFSTYPYARFDTLKTCTLTC